MRGKRARDGGCRKHAGALRRPPQRIQQKTELPAAKNRLTREGTVYPRGRYTRAFPSGRHAPCK
eukprot:5104095-Lingulodinium_polyedra.AAC.1